MKSLASRVQVPLAVFSGCLLILLFGCGDSTSKNPQDSDPGAKSSATDQESFRPSTPETHSSWLSARANDLNTGVSNSSQDATLGREAWTWIAGGRLWQSPVARDGVLYVGDGSLGFYAIRVADGKQLWRSRPRIIKTQKTEVAGPGDDLVERALPKDLDDHYGYSHPVLDEKQVISITEYGVMTAFDLKDGAIIWEHDFDAKVMSSPRICGNKILVNCTDGNFFAFDKSNGKEIWRYWTSAKMLGSSVALLGPKTAVFPGHDRVLHFVDIETGESKKRVDLGRISASTPLVAFGCLYFTIERDGLCCFDLVEGAMRWKKPGVRAGSHSLALSGDNILVHMRHYLYAFHGVTGDLAWKTQLSAEGAMAPCVGPELIYMTSGKATLYAIDPKNGDIKWASEFGDSSRCQPVLVDGLVLVSDFKGRMTAFK